MAPGMRYYKATPHEHCDSKPTQNGLAATSYFGFCLLQPSCFGVAPHGVKRRNVSLSGSVAPDAELRSAALPGQHPGSLASCWKYME
jgi:hypothetical protein